MGLSGAKLKPLSPIVRLLVCLVTLITPLALRDALAQSGDPPVMPVVLRKCGTLLKKQNYPIYPVFWGSTRLCQEIQLSSG